MRLHVFHEIYIYINLNRNLLIYTRLIDDMYINPTTYGKLGLSPRRCYWYKSRCGQAKLTLPKLVINYT